ncbi:hypothetical protein [Streptomyces sp. SID13031]|uniref:hypothetical protein n=1 Tax=Streptomyces sp. SID13031 TaxID=2706046 RepID=UPI0013C72D2F|nr:hypothetical protein [Streptomyces sp. SID13031]NEA36271.1 hypothetical protein [Streptomyces sp. SID13031]
MKLTDLQNELNARAESTDQTPDLLPGVHRKITQTKCRRKAAALGTVGGLAVIAAFAFLIPSLTTSTPQPADEVPRDYVRNGMTLPGLEGADRLEKGWIGDAGDSTLDFSWTPQVQDTRFAGYCNTGVYKFTVSVNDYIVGTGDCTTDPGSLHTGISVSADRTLWLAAPAGKPARVVVRLTDANGRQVRGGDTVVALGIYRTAAVPAEGPPAQTPPTSPDDYVKDGVRYRAKIGGDTLLGAKIADRGKNSFDFTFTAPGGPISLSVFCTAVNGDESGGLALHIKFNGVEAGASGCAGDSIDAGVGSAWIPDKAPPAGQRVNVTVQLESTSGGGLVTKPHDWIGLGIYAKGKQRPIGDTYLNELVEYGGRNYRLRDVSTTPLASVHEMQIRTPPNTPYLVAFGSSGDASEQITVRLSGLSEGTTSSGGGIGTIGQPAGPVSQAIVKATGATKTSPGQLILAIYLPDN